MALTKVSYSMINGAVFNVLDYGAVGDNSNDDTTALQDAIDAAYDAGGGVVYLPANKTFKVTASLINKDNVTIQGEGFTSVIKSATNFKVFNQNTGTVAYDMTWTNFRIVGNASVYSAGSNHGINLFESERSNISNMWFEALDGDGLYIRTNNVNVKNIYCKNCYRQGISVTDGSYISIDNVRGEGTMITLVDIEPNVGDNVYFLTINNVEFTTSTIPALRIYQSAGHSSPYAVLENVVISNITSYGLNLQGITGLTATNLVLRNTDSVETLNVYLCKDASISNVSIVGTTGNTVKTKFKVTGLNNGSISNVTVYGGASIDIDFLNLAQVNLYGITMRNAGGTGLRLRDSFGVTLDGINMSSAGATLNGLLLSPTTTLAQTIIKNAIIYDATNAFTASGNIGDVYIDGSFSNITNTFDIGSVTGGILSNGVLGNYRRNPYGYTAAPTTGTWNVGDVVWSSAPTSGNPPGWVCTAYGTPGTWKAMANLA